MKTIRQERHWLLPFTVGLMAGLGIAVALFLIKFGSGKGGEKMNSENLPKLLKTVDETKVGAIDTVSLDLLSELREIPRSIIDLTFSKDEDLMNRAREVFLGMEDTIIWPVIVTEATISAEERLWLTDVAVEREMRLRRALGTHIEKMITDKTLLPNVAPPGMAEESAPPKRVCDEAYIQLRSLINANEKSYDGLVNRDLFLQGTFDERDEELKKFLTSRTFTNFMEVSDKEED
jgi:hypothetical protein